MITTGEGFLKRTFSLGGRQNEAAQTLKETSHPTALYPSVTDRPADGSKLHPFWRPAHFWDDLEDHDDVEDGEFGGRYPIIDNRPAPPKRSISGKLKRTFAILPIIDDDNKYTKTDRRTVSRTASGNIRVVKRGSQSSLKRGETSNRRRYEKREERFGSGFKNGNRGKVYVSHFLRGEFPALPFPGNQGMFLLFAFTPSAMFQLLAYLQVFQKQ
jgi:hypothetical protein